MNQNENTNGQQQAQNLLSSELTQALQQSASQHAQESQPQAEQAQSPQVTQQPYVAPPAPEPVREPEVRSMAPQEADTGFVSETFAALKSGSLSLGSDIPTAGEQSSRTIHDLFAGINVDLNNIEISADTAGFDLQAIESAEKEQKKVMQVVCCQSSYSAQISALRNQEIQNVSDSNVDFYNFKKRLYKALWKHIESTSVGRMDFVTWMKVTSFFDVETLIYGAYCQTFPYENKYTVNCQNFANCGKPFEAVVNNNTLIEARGREAEIHAKIDEIISAISNPEALIGRSLVHTTKRIALPESKYVFDLNVPSVFDYLEGILSRVDEEKAEEYSGSLSMALFVKRILIPNVVELKRSGKLTFISVEDTEKIVEKMADLPYYDGLQLAEEVNEFTNRTRVQYSIKKVACTHCGHVIEEVPLSMEDVLFTVIRQARTVREEQKPTQSTSTQ